MRETSQPTDYPSLSSKGLVQEDEQPRSECSVSRVSLDGIRLMEHVATSLVNKVRQKASKRDTHRRRSKRKGQKRQRQRKGQGPSDVSGMSQQEHEREM